MYKIRREKYKAHRRKDYWKVAESITRLTVSEYAQKHNYSENYVCKLCRSGAIKAIKFKSHWLIGE
jgi:hypothetical protein